MSKYGSPSAVFMVGGYNLLANKVKGLSCKNVAEMEDYTGIGDLWREFVGTGMMTAELVQQEAVWHTDTGYLHDFLTGELSDDPSVTPMPVCVGFAGNVIGREMFFLNGVVVPEVEVILDNGKLQKGNIKYQVTGKMLAGVILQEREAKTLDWDTESAESVDYHDATHSRTIPITSNSQATPSVVTCPNEHGLTTGDKVLIAGVADSNADINGEQVVTVLSTTTFSVPVDATVSAGTGGSCKRIDSPRGGIAILQVETVTDFTNFIGKVRHSTDDITFADLLAFTDNVDAPFAETVVVAVTVNRYLAFDGDVTGSGSITPLCGFARNE